MLQKLIKTAEKEGLRLAPFIGIGCPGKIEPDGSIDRGAQNLPGKLDEQPVQSSREAHRSDPQDC
jgi:hypothetical protein